MNKETIIDNLQTDLGYIFNTIKDYNFDEKDFVKKFITSPSFKAMLKNPAHKYWTAGESYVVTDFAKTHPINKAVTKPLANIEVKWLGEIIIELTKRYNIDTNKIANKLDSLVKYTEFIDYHSPQEIIKKCNLQ